MIEKTKIIYMKQILFLILLVLMISCKKNPVSEWDFSKRVEIINPLTSEKLYRTPSLTNTSRYLIEEIKNGIKTSLIATVIGDDLTVTGMDGTFLFHKSKDIDRKINSARLVLSCQTTQRYLCYTNTVCSTAYTLSWWTMEVIFAAYCSRH